MRGSAQPGNFKLSTQYSVPDNKEIPSREKKRCELLMIYQTRKHPLSKSKPNFSGIFCIVRKISCFSILGKLKQLKMHVVHEPEIPESSGNTLPSSQFYT